MTTLREAALMALEALLWHYEQGHSNTETGFRLKIDQRAIRQLRAALAEQTVPSDCPDSHQPVAWMYEGEKDFDGRKWSFSWEFTDSRRLAEWKSGTQKKPIPLYTHPPKRKPLTDAEILEAWKPYEGNAFTTKYEFARAIERAHGIGGKE